MKKLWRYSLLLAFLFITAYSVKYYIKNKNPNPIYSIGEKLDSLNGVYVYYNGRVGHTGKRNLTEDGYNIGLEYQCVEFVKRYYYQYYHHKMPDAYGNAKDFFNDSIADGALNTARNLTQYKNPGSTKPAVGDLLIFDGHIGNKYGHVAIVSAVNDSSIEIIQQNPGPFAKSRVNIQYSCKDNQYKLENERILGWLRK